MIRQLRSDTSSSNSRLREIKRISEDEPNRAWLTRAYEQSAKDEKGERTWIVLLGGADTLSFRLRVAQSHLRRDMLPSYWSEVGLLELGDGGLEGARIAHVPLMQPDSRRFSPRTNGVQHDPLAAFDDSRRYPNIALVGFPVAEAAVFEHLQRFEKSRSTLDALSHVLRWLAFGWGAGQGGNPLNDGFGIPSACMLDTVFAAAGMDISPGLESRTSCPEAIWVASRYWYGFYQQQKQGTPIGAYTNEHRYPIEEPRETTPRGRARATESVSTSAPSARQAKAAKPAPRGTAAKRRPKKNTRRTKR